MTTLRPLGPRVTLTALLRISMPRSMRSRASEEKRSSLAAMINSPESDENFFGRPGPFSRDDTQNVTLLHDKEILLVDLDLGARPFAKQHLVARRDIEGREFAGFIPAAGTDGNNHAFLRLLLGGIGDDDPALGLFLTLETSDRDTVVQGTECHSVFFLFRDR